MPVLLINPLGREFMPPSIFPLGIGYLASVLRKLDEVRVIDLDLQRDTGMEKLIESLEKENYEFIGISSMITQYEKVLNLVKLVKDNCRETPVVLCGTGPTSIPDIYFDNSKADIIVRGEGEETVKDLYNRLSSDSTLNGCLGISYRKKDKIIHNGPRPPIQDIDIIEYPSWDLFQQVEIYMENYLFRFNNKRAMGLLTMRGCPGRCTFCMNNFGHRIRKRSVENILGEISILNEQYSVEHIHFLDDTFVIDKKSVFEFCEKFNARFPEMTWSGNARVNFVNYELLKTMANAGCVHLAYGIESGSPEMLKKMKKGITTEQASNAISLTRKTGIKVKGYFIIGMPGETHKTFRETVEFCKKNLIGGEFFFATPMPSTELYSYALSNGLIKDQHTYLTTIGEVRNFVINLTQMNNETLFKIKEKGEEEITLELLKHSLDVPTSTKIDPIMSVKTLPKFN